MTTKKRSITGTALLTAGILMMHGASADNTAATARDLGTDPSQFVTREVVGAADSSDNYKFTLSGPRSVQITLSELSGDADIYLMGDNGVWLSSTKRGYGLSERIRKDLAAGNYRLMVYGWAGSVNHKLQVNSWSPQPAATIKNFLPDLDGMNGNNSSVKASGTIAPTTAYIDYHFTIPERRIINVRGTGSVAAGVTPDTTPNRWTMLQNNQVRDLRLQRGRYLLRVFRNPNSSQSFSFEITARPYDSRDTAGYTTGNARNLGRVGNPPVEIKEYVGRDDFDDYYRVNLAPNSQLNVALTHTRGEGADIRVLDSLGRVVAQSNNNGNAAENIRTDSAAGGVHYVHVKTDYRPPLQKDAHYKMLVGTVPMAAPARQVQVQSGDASESFTTATPFAGVGLVPGSGGKRLVHEESVGTPGDRADVYYFNVACNLGRQIPTFTVQPQSTSRTVNVRSMRFRLFENIDGRPIERSLYTSGPNKPGYRGRSNYQYYLVVTSPRSIPAPYKVTIGHTGCIPV